MAPRARLVTAALLATVLTGGTAACGSGSDPDAGSPAPEAPSSQTPSPTPSPAPSSSPSADANGKPGTKVTTGDSEFGTMLFGADGQAIYIWEVEESATPECYDDCAEAWPPVLTEGKAVAAGDVDPALLGTARRRDGTLQVTYNGHPLYYYAHEGPGEVKCHDVATHGGLWWVVQPDGDRAP